jgi:hypothetical protein
MTEQSRFWNGNTVGDATQSPYDADTEFAEVLAALSGSYRNTGVGGVVANALNELAVTGVATPVSVNTGIAIVHGTWYKNDASVAVAVPTPAGATRYDLIVLRKDWTAQTVRIARIAGVEGGSTPSLTAVVGGTWDVPLATVAITTGGVITVTDARQFVPAGVRNRTRKFLVTPNGLSGASNEFHLPTHINGIGMYSDPGHSYNMYGRFFVPEDFVSGMVIKALVYNSDTDVGSIYARNNLQAIAVGEAIGVEYALSSDYGLRPIVASTTSALQVAITQNPVSIAKGDRIDLYFSWDASHASNTFSDTNWLYFVGWLVEYTADS